MDISNIFNLVVPIAFIAMIIYFQHKSKIIEK